MTDQGTRGWVLAQTGTQIQEVCPALFNLFITYYEQLMQNQNLVFRCGDGAIVALQLVPTGCKLQDIQIRLHATNPTDSNVTIIEIANNGQARQITLATDDRKTGWRWLLNDQDGRHLLINPINQIWDRLNDPATILNPERELVTV